MIVCELGPDVKQFCDFLLDGACPNVAGRWITPDMAVCADHNIPTESEAPK